MRRAIERYSSLYRGNRGIDCDIEGSYRKSEQTPVLIKLNFYVQSGTSKDAIILRPYEISIAFYPGLHAVVQSLTQILDNIIRMFCANTQAN